MLCSDLDDGVCVCVSVWLHVGLQLFPMMNRYDFLYHFNDIRKNPNVLITGCDRNHGQYMLTRSKKSEGKRQFFFI